MALANFKIREKTQSNAIIAFGAMLLLALAALFILLYEAQVDLHQLLTILGAYLLLSLLARIYTH